MMTPEGLLSSSPGPFHLVSTSSLSFTPDGRLTVQKSVTVFSLIKRSVLTDNSTLGGGTAHNNAFYVVNAG